MSKCKKCGEEVIWKEKPGGGFFPPENRDGSRHDCEGKARGGTAPKNAPAASGTETVSGRLESYNTGNATFTVKPGVQKTYALSGTVHNQWKAESFLLPADNHPDIWLRITLDKNKFVQAPWERIEPLPWAREESDPTRGEIKKPGTTPDKMQKAGFENPGPVAPNDRTSPEKPPVAAPAATTPAANPAPQPSQKDIWLEEREEFCNLLSATSREGMPALLQWLVEKSDFFLAPSSTKYHDAREGGLLHHSIETYRNLMELVKIYKLDLPEDGTSLAIIALLHDLCKVNIYKLERKSLPKRDEKTGEIVLDDWGKKIWEDTMIYTVEDQMPLGHGEKSVILLQRFIQLTDTEIFAIRWHMMAYDDSRNSYAGNLAITNASDKYRIIPLFHMADLAASFLERRVEEANS